MKRRAIALIGTVVLAFGLAAGCSQSESEGMMEDAGAAMDDAMDDMQEGMEDAGEAVEGAMDDAGEAVEEAVEEVTGN